MSPSDVARDLTRRRANGSMHSFRKVSRLWLTTLSWVRRARNSGATCACFLFSTPTSLSITPLEKALNSPLRASEIYRGRYRNATVSSHKNGLTEPFSTHHFAK